MSSRLENLSLCLKNALGDRIVRQVERLGEITIEVRAADLIPVALALRDRRELAFEELIDLCGMDYSAYGKDGDGVAVLDIDPQDRPAGRYAAVYHLLSVSNNQRLRLRAFADSDELPVVPSLVEVWSSANWYEREAFDLYGIVFDGHPDLRRILTDYGFIGHPFRKDFPLEGNVEMRYDPEQQRVIYQPVTIENRINVPRVIREEGYHSPYN